MEPRRQKIYTVYSPNPPKMHHIECPLQVTEINHVVECRNLSTLILAQGPIFSKPNKSNQNTGNMFYIAGIFHLLYLTFNSFRCQFYCFFFKRLVNVCRIFFQYKWRLHINWSASYQKYQMTMQEEQNEFSTIEHLKESTDVIWFYRKRINVN